MVYEIVCALYTNSKILKFFFVILINFLLFLKINFLFFHYVYYIFSNYTLVEKRERENLKIKTKFLIVNDNYINNWHERWKTSTLEKI